MKKNVGDPGYPTWAKTTVTAWEFFRAHAATTNGKNEALTRLLGLCRGEAQFTLTDELIHKDYDVETGHHKYGGATEDIIGKSDPKTGTQLKVGKYQADAKDAQKYDDQLQHIVATYPSLDWVPAAIARQGTLYDSLRTGLYNATPPAVKYFTPQQERLLAQLENSGRAQPHRASAGPA